MSCLYTDFCISYSVQALWQSLSWSIFIFWTQSVGVQGKMVMHTLANKLSQQVAVCCTGSTIPLGVFRLISSLVRPNQVALNLQGATRQTTCLKPPPPTRVYLTKEGAHRLRDFSKIGEACTASKGHTASEISRARFTYLRLVKSAGIKSESAGSQTILFQFLRPDPDFKA